ncbi:hypothetical protein TruAng_010616 [Truncatella angustata]|nr:hypothetical protein TruAng_010616 [Truncatella angustata]
MSDPKIYTIGWICAVEAELIAATALLDEEHNDLEDVPVHDNNTYTLGRVGKHNVAIAALPHWQYGLVSAANVARDMIRTFPNIRIGLMVGIGGGAPSSKHDIRLGDVVVSSPGYGNGGVFQYDYGKTMQDASFAVTGQLNQPPQCLLTAMSSLKAQYKRRGHNIAKVINDVLDDNPRLRKEYRRPESDTDRLYSSCFKHNENDDIDCVTACDDASKLVDRVERTEEQDDPMIHFGLIASANQLMKDATIRDRLSAERDVLCFEMEAAGLMNHFPCLVIRGICDYSDTHKNIKWQGYAAMTAATYAKNLLYKVAPNKVEAERKLVDVLSDVIEDLQKNQDLTRTLLYFYFDFTDTRKQSFENVIRSLIIQMYYRNKDAQKHLNSLYSTCRDGKDQPSFDSLQKAFTNMIHELREVWIVLDALDECTPRIELLSWTQDLAQNYQPLSNVHILITSRPEQDIKSAIERHADNEQMIAIRDDLLEADIRNYVQARVREHEGLKRWQGRLDIQDRIEASLLDKADGMFRWVSCQLDALEECLEQRSLLKALEDLPRTLDETYERILANIPSAHKHYTIRILQFLTYSEKPLRLDEAVDAIAVDIGEDATIRSRFDPQDRLPVPQEITRYCSSLVILVEREGKYNEERIVEEVQLAHFSVKDYLTSNRLEKETAQHLEQRVARTSMAIVCLSYLLEPKPETDTIGLFPFSRYSARYWMGHAAVGDCNHQQMVALATYILSNASKLKSWCRLYDPDRPWADRPENISQRNHIAPGLYYASLGGLSHCVKSMVADKTDVNAQGGHYGNALQAASSKGHREIIQMLIDAKAEVNAQGGHYGNALQAASLGGHKEIVQMLMDAKAEVNAQGGHYGNALQAASLGGHKEIIEMLMDAKAEVNAQGGYYGTALQAASSEGHKEVVQMLMDAKAEVNAQGGEYGNALQAASFGGHKEIVQMLMDAEAEVNAQSGHYGNALQAASYGGHKEIVQLLIDAEAEVNAQGGEYGNALQAASSRGYKEIVKLLLGKGAELSVINKDGDTPLHDAISGGHTELVKLLIENAGDPNITNNRGNTPLNSASISGYVEIVKVLLEKGGDLSIPDIDGFTPLNNASYNGHVEVVNLLVKYGADPMISENNGWAPLSIASSRGHVAVVKALIFAEKCRINDCDDNGLTALAWAAKRGHVEIVDMLVKRGAHTSISDGQWATCINLAAKEGHLDVVKLLLDHGCEWNMPNTSGSNALQLAILGGHSHVEAHLLTIGAETPNDVYGFAALFGE